MYRHNRQCISLLTKYLLKKKSCFINNRFKISKAENRRSKKIQRSDEKKKLKSNNSRQNTTQKTKDFQKTFVKKKE